MRKKKFSPFSDTDGRPDYKNVDELRRYIMDSGKIVPGRITNVSAKTQRLLSTAIKRARFLALMPYTDQHKD